MKRASCGGSAWAGRRVNSSERALSIPTETLAAVYKSAGELADHFPVSKPTMSAHFAVLREAGLIDSNKQGKAIIYRLKMSVLEEALMEFSELLGLNLAQRARRSSGHSILRKAPTK